ncbi:MAG: phlA [Marmoricola sp.]|nr:phlA [Marmoricola sp.]
MTTTVMPPSLLGMDSAQVSALGTRLVQDADAMDQLVTAVRQLVSGLDSSWRCPDFQRFHAEWEATHSPALAAIAQGMRSHGQAALTQAQQQDQASAAVGGLVGGTAAGGVAALGSSYAAGAGKPTDRDLLLLSGGSYQDSGDVTGSNGVYHRLGDAELRALGIDPASMDTRKSGFAAALYRGPDGKYVLSYRGTNDGFGLTPDWKNNVAGGVGISEQSRQAVALAQKVSAGVGADNVTYTGHSLGGRLACLGSIVTGSPAVTYNAAGVGDVEFAYALHAAGKPDHLAGVIAKYGAISAVPGPAKLLFLGVDPFSAERAQLAGRQIRSFNVDGEILSTIQDNSPLPDALGSRTELPAVKGGWMSVERHGMDSVIASWDKAHPGGK